MPNDQQMDEGALFSVAGKVAIVTGAAGGIGRAVSQGLAAAAATVVLADVREEALLEVDAGITDQGQKCLSVPVDLADPSQRTHLVERAVTAYQRIDILVNCAAVTTAASSEDYPDELWDRTLNVNVTAIFHLC